MAQISRSKEASGFSMLAPEVQFELDRVLASEFFRGSKRCQAFLKYVVEAAAIGAAGELKERTLGMAIWGRPADYDTGADAIVRVKANEVRKRLAHYNAVADPERSVVIDLQPGSYVPQITVSSPSENSLELVPVMQPLASRRRFFSWTIAAALIACILAVAVVLIRPAILPASPVSQFWSPVLYRGDPIICTASPSVYNPRSDLAQTATDTNVAFGVRAELQRLGHPSRIGKADDITLADLRTTPVVLIGGPLFNRWTMAMTRDLRFTLETVDNQRRIVDRENPSRFWEDQRTSSGMPIDEYVVVTRLIHSPAGQPMICIAGIGPYGSMAGERFITDASSLSSVLKYAPGHWAGKNLQFVLHTRINAGTPQMPELVAATYW